MATFVVRAKSLTFSLEGKDFILTHGKHVELNEDNDRVVAWVKQGLLERIETPQPAPNKRVKSKRK